MQVSSPKMCFFCRMPYDSEYSGDIRIHIQKDRRCRSTTKDKLFLVITLLRNKCKRDESFSKELMTLTSPTVNFSTMNEEDLSVVLWKDDVKFKNIFIVSKYALDIIVKNSM